MPYNITLSNGTDLITGGLLDNTTDSANSSLTLVGKNYKSYGLFLNQNFVRLMENFALATAPTAPLPGQLWFNSTSKLLNVNIAATKGTANAIWKTVAGMTLSATTPTNAYTGEQWYDTTNGQLKLYTGTEWRLIGPLSRTATGNTGAIPDTVTDAPPSTTFVVIKFFIDNVLVGIWSKDSPFASDVAGFPTIKKGLNLHATLGHKFWGNSEVADSLYVSGVAVAGSNFVRNDTSATINGSLVLTNDGGITFGAAGDFVGNVSSGTVTLRNQTNNRDLIFSVKSSGLQTNFLRGNSQSGLAEVYTNPVASSSGLSVATKNYVDILSGSVNGTANFFGDITPSSNLTYTLGNTTNRFTNIFSQSILVGNVNAANTFATISNVAQIYLGADIIPTANISSNLGSTGVRFNTLNAAAVSLTGSLVVGTTANVGGSANVGQNLAVTGTTTMSGISNFGSNINVTGNIISTASTASTTTNTGALILAGGAGVAGAIFAGGNIVAAAGTASTNTTTGALVVTGGMGVGGAAIIGGNIVAAAGTASTNNTTGALVVSGGVGVSGAIYNSGVHVSGGNIVAISGVASTTTATGALVVIGGAGISGAVNTGANVTVGSNLIATGASVSGNVVVGNNLFAGAGSVAGALTVGGSVIAASGSVSGNLSVNGIITTTTMPAGTSNTAVATTAFVQNNLAPTGALMMWSTGSAPTGWLLCNGTAVSRTTYAALFAVIGTTFGVGDNSTTFNLPNYNNRMPIGAGGLYAVGATGGSKDAVVVSHTHTATVTDPGHNHQTGSTSVEAGFTQAGIRTTTTSGSATSTASTGISVGISTSGSSGTDANLPPYLAINFIIKT